MSHVSISMALGSPKPKGQALRAGVYHSLVTLVSYDEDYVNGSAIRIRYRLTSSSGVDSEYTELFHNTLRNPRTKAFFDYLNENGISLDALEMFEGCKEELILKRQVGSKYLTIESRRFLGRGGEDG